MYHILPRRPISVLSWVVCYLWSCRSEACQAMLLHRTIENDSVHIVTGRAFLHTFDLVFWCYCTCACAMPHPLCIMECSLWVELNEGFNLTIHWWYGGLYDYFSPNSDCPQALAIPRLSKFCIDHQLVLPSLPSLVYTSFLLVECWWSASWRGQKVDVMSVGVAALNVDPWFGAWLP